MTVKRFIFAAISLTLAAALLTGCSSNIDPDTVVLRVNGEQITAERVYQTLTGYIQKIGINLSELQTSSNKSIYEDLKSAVVDEEVSKALVRQNAEKKGLTISAERKRELEREADDKLNNIRQTIFETVQKKKDASINVEAETQRLYEEYLAKHNLSKESILEELIQQETERMLRDAVYSDVDTSNEAVQGYFNDLAQKQEVQAQENPKQYLQLQGSDVPYYHYPDNAAYVKILMVEHENLAALEACNDEETMDRLIQEIGVEETMKQEPYRTQGYLVIPDAGIIPVIEDAAAQLETPGEFSPVLANGSRYVKLMLVKRMQPGPVEFEEIKDDLREEYVQDQQDDVWEDTMEDWKEDADIAISNLDF